MVTHKDDTKKLNFHNVLLCFKIYKYLHNKNNAREIKLHIIQYYTAPLNKVNKIILSKNT